MNTATLFIQALEQRTLLSQYGLVDSYGSHGVASTEFGLGTRGFQEMLIVQLPDQSTIVAGAAGFPETNEIRGQELNRIVMAKIDARGIVVNQWTSTQIMAHVSGIAMQSDGKLVVTGVDLDSNIDGVSRFTTKGKLDTSFAGDGVLELLARSPDFLGSTTGVMLDPQGRILVMEQLHESGQPRAVVRVAANGTLDTGFGQDGSVQFVGGSAFQAGFQSGGKILLADDASVRRLTDSGAVDSTFGQAGVASYGGRMLVLSDRRILLNSADTARRLNINGALDTSFGDNGTATVLQGLDVAAPASFVQADGSITVADKYGVGKLTADGQPDPDFGTSGRLNNYKDQIPVSGIGADGGANFVLASNGDLLMSGGSSIYGFRSPAMEVLAKFQAQPNVFLGANGWLSITGTDNGDSIVVTALGDQARVSLNGVVKTFALTAVKSVDILCGNGDNNIRVALAVPTTVNSGAGDDVIVTGDGDDSILSGNGNDSVVANGGDDIVRAGGGRDTLDGGAGNDEVSGGSDGTSLSGGDGNDSMGSSGRSTVNGGNGNDNIYSGDTSGLLLIGGDGFDTFVLGKGNETVYGGNGGGYFVGGGGAGTGRLIYGGDGIDQFLFRQGLSKDTIYSGDGNDSIWAGDGDNLIYAGAGNDSIRSGAGQDTLWGEIGYDWMRGGGGDDLMNGGAGKDRMWGDDGNDRIYGRNSNDILDGGAGDDRLVGGDGFDRIFGDEGDDVIFVQENDHDYVDGGTGTDTAFRDDLLDELLNVETLLP